MSRHPHLLLADWLEARTEREGEHGDAGRATTREEWDAYDELKRRDNELYTELRRLDPAALRAQVRDRPELRIAQQAISNHTRTLAAVVRFAGGLDSEQRRDLLSITETGINAQARDREALVRTGFYEVPLPDRLGWPHLTLSELRRLRDNDTVSARRDALSAYIRDRESALAQADAADGAV